ncbi:MAG: hypothetical protein LHV69_01565 [Elusimicrobia bacterium]|nr:hypothetical protein [Candidatus Obscuribacterium magneticum]
MGVIPAKAGIHDVNTGMDSRFRGNDPGLDTGFRRYDDAREEETLWTTV